MSASSPGTSPDIAGHLISASVMAAPAVIVTSKLMWPETGEPVTRGGARVKMERIDANSIDAAARGAGEGLTLALNVGAMLLAFIALISLANAVRELVALLVRRRGLHSSDRPGLARRAARLADGHPLARCRRASGRCWGRRPCSTSSSPTFTWRR